MKSYTRRLERLERVVPADSFPDIAELIHNAAFYDELTTEQRQRYMNFLEMPSLDLYEEIHLAVGGDLHFQLEKRERPLLPGSPEFMARVQEIEKLLSDD